MSDDRAGPRVGTVLERQIMPRRRPGADAGAASADARPDTEAGAGAEGQAGEAEVTPVSLESLRRVLDGLRTLS